jgi:LCP family protein required for cell wall assembly
VSPDDRPEYNVYRSRRRPMTRAGSGDLDGLRDRLRRRREREPGERRPLTAGRVLKWVAAAVAGWLLLSGILFLISAQLEAGVSGSTEDALAGGGSTLTGSTILVLGSDQRQGESLDQSNAPGRSDSIMLLRAAFGSVRKLSIPRDAYTDIPGHGSQKINAAFALGGPALTVETVEAFMGNGLKINHVIEVDFEDFPELIDSLGGITVNSKSRICSPEFDNFWKGLRFPKGEQKLDGTKALGYARVRKNNCAPGENDIDRAERQQQVLSGIRDRLLSPTTFFRLPWVAWNAPKTIKSDMGAGSMFGLFTDLITGGSDDTAVLKPSCLGCGPGNSLLVSEGERRDAVDRLLDG